MSVIAKVRQEVVLVGAEFSIDPSTETVVSVEDNKDGTLTVNILSYIRKGNGSQKLDLSPKKARTPPS